MGVFGNFLTTSPFPQKENIIRHPDNYPQRGPYWRLHRSKNDMGSSISIYIYVFNPLSVQVWGGGGGERVYPPLNNDFFNYKTT